MSRVATPKRQWTGTRTSQSKTRSQSRSSIKGSQSLLHDSECVSLRKQLFENEDFSEIDTDTLKKLLTHLREVLKHFNKK